MTSIDAPHTASLFEIAVQFDRPCYSIDHSSADLSQATFEARAGIKLRFDDLGQEGSPRGYSPQRLLSLVTQAKSVNQDLV